MKTVGREAGSYCVIVEKKDEYLRMMSEMENAKKNSPIFKYQTPDRW